jgi:hypothetical protein|eukprot:COSAG02_NODE_900_length_16073_cov_87.296607_9_plen_66_part_00
MVLMMQRSRADGRFKSKETGQTQLLIEETTISFTVPQNVTLALGAPIAARTRKYHVYNRRFVVSR